MTANKTNRQEDKIKAYITKAEDHRKNIGFDHQVSVCEKVLKNDLPTDKKNSEKGRFFINNWCLKGRNWLVSLMAGGDINISLQSIMGTYEKKMGIMDCEINHLMDQFQWVKPAEKVLNDKYSFGFGCMKIVWREDKRSDDYLSGIPEFQHKDCRSIYLDPHPDKCYYIIEKIEIDSEDLINYYPEHEALKKKYGEKPKTCIVYIIQHKKEIKEEQVVIYNALSNESKNFLKSDYDTIMAEYGELPDGLQATEPFWITRDEVTEYVYLEDEHKILSSEVIGEDFTYIILKGFQEDKSCYSFSKIFPLADMQDMSVKLMTQAYAIAMKHHKPIMVIHPEGIRNWNDIKDRINEPDVQILIDSNFLRQYPKEEVLRFIPPPQWTGAHEYIESKITEVIKQLFGITETLLGDAAFKGISGYTANLFNSHAKVYHKTDYVQFIEFIKDCARVMMEFVKKYRNYRHVILGLNEDGANELLEVASDNDTSLDKTNYEITVHIDQDVDAQQERDLQILTFLLQQGVVTPEDYLQATPLKNKDALSEKYTNRMKELQQQQQMQYQQQGGVNG